MSIKKTSNFKCDTISNTNEQNYRYSKGKSNKIEVECVPDNDKLLNLMKDDLNNVNKLRELFGLSTLNDLITSECVEVEVTASSEFTSKLDNVTYPDLLDACGTSFIFNQRNDFRTYLMLGITSEIARSLNSYELLNTVALDGEYNDGVFMYSLSATGYLMITDERNKKSHILPTNLVKLSLVFNEAIVDEFELESFRNARSLQRRLLGFYGDRFRRGLLNIDDALFMGLHG